MTHLRRVAAPSRPARVRTVAAPLVLGTMLALGGCDGNGATGSTDAPSSEGGSLGFRIAPPARLRMVDRGDSVPRLRMGDSLVSLSPRDAAGGPLPAGVSFDDPRVESLGATRRYARGSRIDIALDWEIDGVPVWRAERTIEIDGDVTVVIDADDYRTEGLDADADGYSNFEELSAGSNPNSAASIPPDEGPGADFAGDWIGAVVYTQTSDTFTFRSYSSVETFVEELNANVLGPEDGIVIDAYYLRISPSGALISFDTTDDEFASVVEFQDLGECTIRYEGTLSFVSEDRYVFDAGAVFPFESDPVLVQRRDDAEAGDTLWISLNGEFWQILAPHDNDPVLDALADC